MPRRIQNRCAHQGMQIATARQSTWQGARKGSAGAEHSAGQTCNRSRAGAWAALSTADLGGRLGGTCRQPPQLPQQLVGGPPCRAHSAGGKSSSVKGACRGERVCCHAAQRLLDALDGSARSAPGQLMQGGQCMLSASRFSIRSNERGPSSVATLALLQAALPGLPVQPHPPAGAASRAPRRTAVPPGRSRAGAAAPPGPAGSCRLQ